MTSVFPDKKERRADFKEVSDFLTNARDLFERFGIGQTSAVWEVHPKYPKLPVMILLMTDTHFGSVGVNTTRIAEHLDIVQNTDNFYLVHNGDHTDNFNSTIHASGMSENPIPPKIQGRVWANRITELDRMGKIGVLGFGNHDDFTFDASQADFYESFFSEMRCPIFTEGGEVSIWHGMQAYNMAMTHRYWGTSKLNPTNANKRFLNFEYPDADIIFLGHTHQSEGLHFDQGGKDRIAVIGGTYKDRDGWARKRGISGRAGSPGWVLCVYPDRRAMKLYKDVAMAQQDMELYIADTKRTRRRNK